MTNLKKKKCKNVINQNDILAIFKLPTILLPNF